MFTELLGELAALGTAVSWAASTIFFGIATRRASAPVVNLVRILMAAALAVALALLMGGAWPTGGQSVALVLSGVLGLAVGDAAWFRSLHILGARRSSVLGALWPGVAALLAGPLLGEALDEVVLLGLCLTIGGVAWVQLERSDDGEVEGSMTRGLVWGVAAIVCQALGYVLAKVGLGTAPDGAWLSEVLGVSSALRVDSMSATAVRTLAAAVGIGALAVVMRGPAGLSRALRDRGFLRSTTGGVVFGAVLGVWLSMVALEYTTTAIAGAIIGTSPIFVIPMVRFVHGYKPSWRAWAGAIVAAFGIAVLSLGEWLGS